MSLKKTILASVAALFLATGTAQQSVQAAAKRDCIREMRETFGVSPTQAKRMCDPKNDVKPDEYGWVCEVDPQIRIYKEKGVGTRLKRDVVCE